MSDALQAFHFLRPWWLLALLPALWLARACLAQNAATAAWARVIEPALLAALLLPQAVRRGPLPLALLAAGWSLAVIGLAGPAWERLPEPVHRRGDALVVGLDLSASMLAADLSPTRLARARFKLNDLLATRRDAYTALLAYAGDAHVVTPLSDDTGTLSAMLPALDPGIMPVQGNDPVAALRLGLELLRGAGAQEGRVLLVTDALEEAQARRMAAMLDGTGVSLAVLAVGTRDGAPVPLAEGGFARDRSGGIAVPRLDVEGMRAAAGIAGAAFHEISVDDSDVRALLPESLSGKADTRKDDNRVYDQWRDRAPWVALCLLPLAAIGFRRGWLLLLPLCLGLQAPRAEALEWQDLWLRKDQQGAAALAAGDAARAASLFNDPAWKGSAQYQASDWSAAAESFARSEGADADYNRGNALARAGKLPEALAAYDAALKASPGMQDAAANRKLVEDLLRQQQSAPKDPSSSPKSGDGTSGEQQQSGQQNGKSRSDNSGKSDNSDPSGKPDNSGKGEKEQSGSAAKPSAEDAAGSEQNADSRSPQAKEEAGASSSAPTPGEDAGAQTADGAVEADGAAKEQDQAVEQWLRQVPDDPGALLRRKFEYEARQRAGGERQ